MSLGVPNAKLAAGGEIVRSEPQSRKHKVSTSIAEQATFIPKPHKRVEFESQEAPVKLLGSKDNNSESVALLGSKDKAEGGNGAKISRGQLGSNGISARFSNIKNSVEMVVLKRPEKIDDAIVTQEEGRQVNHHEIHFTQQYDAYGRPRIGFSREPYDFAATKYVSITSQTQFKDNVSRTHEKFDKYLPDSTKEKVEIPIFGATSDPKAHFEVAPDDVDVLGPEPIVGKERGELGAEESLNESRPGAPDQEEGAYGYSKERATGSVAVDIEI